jgi:signal recognition particle subunit SRP54
MKGAEIGDDALRPVEAIIRSMTALERRKPELLNGSRRTRIANGSGTTVGEVNRLVKQFQEMQKMMKRMGASSRGGKKGKGRLAGMAGLGGMQGAPGGFPQFN